MSTRNKNAGSIFERFCRTKLIDSGIYPKCETSRYESRKTDDDGVDLVNTPGTTWQCKSLAVGAPYHKLIQDLKKKGYTMPIIAHEYTKKSKTGKFMVKGRYAILELDDLLFLLSRLQL